ncbi:hypothetical protein TNCV_4290201 [Trichonephila clavipes]|nr:hypothetical protein TNCV_4290201 [Trichonephila clavipes]
MTLFAASEVDGATTDQKVLRFSFQPESEIRYNLKKRPPPQPRIDITTVGDLYSYLEAEKLRYVIAKFHHERLNEKRMLYVLKEKPFHFDFR